MLALASLLGAALRAQGLARYGITHWDEGLAWSGADWFATLGAAGHYSPTHAPPLVPLLLALPRALLGDLPLAGAAMTALASILLIPLAALLLRELAGPRAAVYGALALALSPLHTSFAPSLLTESWYALLLVLALLASARCARLGPDATRRDLLAVGVSVALLQATKYNGALALAPLLAVDVLRLARGRVGLGALVRAWCWVAGPVALVVGANICALMVLGKWGAFVEHYGRFVGASARPSEVFETLQLFALRVEVWALALCGLVLLPRRWASLLLPVALLLWLAFALRYSLYLRLLVPPATLLILAAACAAEGRGSRRLGHALGLVLLASLGWLAWRPPVERPPALDGYTRAVRELDALAASDAGAPVLLLGQRHVWRGLEREHLEGAPGEAAALELCEQSPAVRVVWDIGAVSRLRGWSIERPGEERFEVRPAWDVLQNNLTLEELRALADPQGGVRERAYQVHSTLMSGQEARALLAGE